MDALRGAVVNGSFELPLTTLSAGTSVNFMNLINFMNFINSFIRLSSC